ncbi:unnamed protein product [Mytilus edulis]|uniref:Tyrosine-protein kinase ephrin type A/B receptor-like domain-containing protein n=1 Tax=Mytilus edulis TaxID=6550 RepID=A0A8S3VEN9_MYTED|nr:unnamed protein product [Mytilus edulis]
MMILEAAKVVLTIAQLAVDKSRGILYIAEGVLEVAKIGLEVAKRGIEIAKKAIEVIKYTVKAALYVFELIVQGIQQLIDVKNCGFEIELSTQDKALFQVGCDVKAFGLGWTTFQFWFDFRHPVTSILRIAKATVNTLLDSVKNVLGKRKKRAETSALLNDRTYYRNIIENITSYSSIHNMTLEELGISEKYAKSDYNITADELSIVLDEIKSNMLDDPVISEIANVREVAYDMINSGMDEANSSQSLVVECAPGSYYLFGYCIPCPKGTYTNKWNQNSCVNCPTGYTTDGEGSIQDTECHDSTPLMQILVGTFFGLTVVVIAVIILLKVMKGRNLPSMQTAQQNPVFEFQ